MKVWVLERCYDYEGCDVLGVFSTQEKAQAAGDVFADFYDPGGAWYAVPRGDGFKRETLSARYTVTPWDVDEERGG